MNSSDLPGGDHHHATCALCAAALVETAGWPGLATIAHKVLRLRPTQAVQVRQRDLAGALRIWTERVIQKGPGAKGNVRDAQLAQALYRPVGKFAAGFAVAQYVEFHDRYHCAMDIRTYQFCLAARALAATHGCYFASAFLAENGIGIKFALAALAPRPLGQTPQVPAVLSYL